MREFVIGFEVKVDEQTHEYYENRVELILKAVLTHGVT